MHQGQYVENKIKELGMTKKSVAEKLSTSRQNLSNILDKKEISHARLKKLSKILNEDLFGVFYDRPQTQTVEEPSGKREYELHGQVVLLERLLEKNTKKAFKEVLGEVLEEQNQSIEALKQEIIKLNAYIDNNFDWSKSNLDNEKAS